MNWILISIDVTVAKDGQEAFELVKESMEQKNLYDLIFMDIQVRSCPSVMGTYCLPACD
jgi:osomolarity two-component system sensor histidine kinase SLN1